MRTALPSGAISTPVSSGRASSCEAARTTWRTALGQGRPAGRSGRVRRSRPPPGTPPPGTCGGLKRRAGRGDLDVLPVVREGHRARLQRRTMSVGEPGRDDTTPVVDPDDLVGHVDRQVEVGPGDRQAVPRRMSSSRPREHRGRADGLRRPGRPWPTSRRASRVRIGTSPKPVLSRVPQSSLREGEVYELVRVVRAVDCGRHASLPAGRRCEVVPTAVWDGRGSGGRPGPVAWGRGAGCPQAHARIPQPLPLAYHSMGRARTGRRGQAEPARICWMSSVTCS